ncbi:MAG: ATP-dependent RNA helicase DeaD [Sodalis sp.]|nr:MAG: ATP-dependent RNA helicase DeaD [Sodalis sp.]
MLHLLAGRDVPGMAQPGSGKTAADPELAAPQVLVLAPTRELAAQIVEAWVNLPSI